MFGGNKTSSGGHKKSGNNSKYSGKRKAKTRTRLLDRKTPPVLTFLSSFWKAVTAEWGL